MNRWIYVYFLAYRRVKRTRHEWRHSDPTGQRCRSLSIVRDSGIFQREIQRNKNTERSNKTQNQIASQMHGCHHNISR